MKFFVVSDIHGDSYWAAKAVETFEAEHADRLVLLGDILYHGPRNDLPGHYAPKDVIGILNPLADKILAVRGNCEAEVDQMVLPFPVLADYALLEAGDRVLFATHGHHYNADALPPLQPGDILLHGHTHIPECRAVDGITVMNPGSVSIPKNGAPHSYMTMEDGIFAWKDMDGAEFLRFCAV